MLASLTTPELLADQSLIAQQVFATMGEMEVIPAAVHRPGTAVPIASMIEYAAPARGALLIECEPVLAFAFTSRLMSLPLPAAFDDDVADAMGELANMIGGNFKGLMPPGVALSTPVVLRGEQLQALLTATTRLSRICLDADPGHCCLSLLTLPVLPYD